jgi:acetyl-CoA carboxylase biotin carboxylase subunit
MTTGIYNDRQPLPIAAGEPLTVTGRAPRSGHAIEIRINAEDPRRDFAPAAGTITKFRPPLGPGVRTDPAESEGAAIPPFYDTMNAKLIVHHHTRDAAIARAIRALEELEVEGIPTTRDVALDILRSPEFRGGNYSTSYLAEMEGRLPSMLPEVA